MSSSSFYFKTRLFFVGESIKAKANQKRFVGFSYTINGQIVEDERIKKILSKLFTTVFHTEKLTPKKLIIRTDNGPQFKSKATKSFMDEMKITHEFGYKNNPNSQAFIESHHSELPKFLYVLFLLISPKKPGIRSLPLTFIFSIPLHILPLLV